MHSLNFNQYRSDTAHKVYRCPSVLSLLKCLSFLVGLGIHVPEGHGAIRAKIGPGANFRSAFSFQCHASPCLETKVLVPVPEHCRRCLTRLCVFGKQLMSTTAQQTDDRMSLYSNTYWWLVHLAVLGTFLSSNATRLDAIKSLIIELIVICC